MAELGAAELAQLTKDLDDSKKLIFQSQFTSEKKDRGTATILAIFMYDRIWLGDIGLGIAKIITAGLCGVWWLIDIFTAGSRADDYNRTKAREIIAALNVNYPTTLSSGGASGLASGS
jgi:TM2 domain-containing membrane protein YozV